MTQSLTDQIAAAAAAWRASGRVRRPSEVAAEYGLDGVSPTALQRLVPELSLPDKRDNEGRSRDEMVAAVRKVAARNGITGWMSTVTYDRLRIEGEPSGALITSRNKWRDIAVDAGLDGGQARAQAPGFGERQFSDDDIDAAVLAFIRDTDRKSLSAVEFERFLSRNPGMPSLATVRNRFRRQRGITAISGIYEDVQERSALRLV